VSAIARIRRLTDLDLESRVGRGLCRCWLDVSNAGGAVGFPFLPVAEADVRDAAKALARKVEAGDVLVFVAERDDQVLGWVSLRLNRSDLTSHWASIERLQSRPEIRGQGIGVLLLNAAVDHARSIGLEQLWLVVRGGEGLEGFYSANGWEEIGRHPGALRLSAGDDRDEVSMMLRLPNRSRPASFGRGVEATRMVGC